MKTRNPSLGRKVNLNCLTIFGKVEGSFGNIFGNLKMKDFFLPKVYSPKDLSSWANMLLVKYISMQGWYLQILSFFYFTCFQNDKRKNMRQRNPSKINFDRFLSKECWRNFLAWTAKLSKWIRNIKEYWKVLKRCFSYFILINEVFKLGPK